MPVKLDDSTAPITVNVGALDLQDGPLKATITSGPVGAHWTARPSLTLSAHVDDPEGVRDVAIWGTTTTTCIQQNGLASISGPGLAGGPIAQSTDPAKAGEMTRTVREVPYVIDPKEFKCPANSTRFVAEQSFWAEGTNFAGVTVRSSLLTLTYSSSPDPERPRPVAADPFTGDGGALHSTAVEPDTFSNGSTAVAVFQAGRFPPGGGSTGIGFARSGDAGKTWTSGYLPNLTLVSGGDADRATDPSVAFDAKHGVWLANVLRLRGPFGERYPEGPSDYSVSRSTDDGRTWSDPIVAVPEPPGKTEWAHDQGWLACDGWPDSKFYGRCYIDNLNVVSLQHDWVFSDDGGLTWTPPVTVTTGGSPKIVIAPRGAVVVLGTGSRTNPDVPTIRAKVSTDGGATFAPSVEIGQAKTAGPSRFFAPPIVTVDRAASDGTIFAAWSSCTPRGDSCDGNDIVVSSSTNGTTWTAPRAVTNGTEHHVLPGIAIDAATSGATLIIGIQFYTLPKGECDESCDVTVNAVISKDGGASFSPARRISDMVSKVGWTSFRSSFGDPSYFVGDYVSSSMAGGKFITTFPLATRTPDGGHWTQPLWTATIQP